MQLVKDIGGLNKQHFLKAASPDCSGLTAISITRKPTRVSVCYPAICWTKRIMLQV